MNPQNFTENRKKTQSPPSPPFYFTYGLLFWNFRVFSEILFMTAQIFKMWQIFSTEKRFWGWVLHWKALMRFSLTSKEQSAQMVRGLGGLLEKVWSFSSIVFCWVFCFNQVTPVYKRDFITLINFFLIRLFFFFYLFIFVV